MALTTSATTLARLARECSVARWTSVITDRDSSALARLGGGVGVGWGVGWGGVGDTLDGVMVSVQRLTTCK